MTKRAVRKKIESEVVRRSARLRIPRNYWKGKPEREPFRPENILLFRRCLAAQLMAPSRGEHHRFILIANLKGEGKVALDRQVFRLQEGESLLIFPFQSHCYLELAPARIHWTFITFEHVGDPRLEALRHGGGIPLGEEGYLFLRNILRAWQSKSGSDVLPLQLGLWLHHQLEALGGKRRSASVAALSPPSEENLVGRVNRLIFDHRDRTLSVGQMAAELGVSSSSLRERFRGATGRSLGRHARQIRLNFACELLSNTDLRIEEISQRCGYDSLFAFSRAFRQAQGIAPSHYRRRKTEDGD